MVALLIDKMKAFVEEEKRRSENVVQDVKVPYNFTFEGMFVRKKKFSILFWIMLIPIICGLIIQDKDVFIGGAIIALFAGAAEKNLNTMILVLAKTSLQAHNAKLAGREVEATQDFVDKLLSFYVYDTLFTAGITVIGSGFCARVLYEYDYLFMAGIFFVVFIFEIISTGWLLKNPVKYYLEKWTRKKV